MKVEYQSYKFSGILGFYLKYKQRMSKWRNKGIFITLNSGLTRKYFQLFHTSCLSSIDLSVFMFYLNPFPFKPRLCKPFHLQNRLVIDAVFIWSRKMGFSSARFNEVGGEGDCLTHTHQAHRKRFCGCLKMPVIIFHTNSKRWIKNFPSNISSLILVFKTEWKR